MASSGKVDFSQLKEFIQDAETKLGEEQIEAFIEACAKELAARLLTKVIKRTPVGDYPKVDGQTVKMGGTLRRGWTAEKQQSVQAYVKNLTVTQVGDMYTIEIVNPVEYASYVEYGHRQTPGRFVPAIGKRLKASWVEGKFMLTISTQEIQQAAPAILEKKLKRKLGEVFG